MYLSLHIYNTTITQIFISRLSIDVIVLTPSTINYILYLNGLCIHPSHAYSAIPILFCCATVSHSVSSIKFDMLHVYKQLYTCLYTHLNKYNQLVIAIFYLYSDCLIHLCIIMY